MGMASWFTGALGAMGLDQPTGEVVQAAAQPESEWDWVSHGLKSALPQILNVTGKKAASPRASSASASAKPVAGNASSAMQVPQMIGKSASQSPLDNLNKWSNTF